MRRNILKLGHATALPKIFQCPPSALANNAKFSRSSQQALVSVLCSRVLFHFLPFCWTQSHTLPPNSWKSELLRALGLLCLLFPALELPFQLFAQPGPLETSSWRRSDHPSLEASPPAWSSVAPAHFLRNTYHPVWVAHVVSTLLFYCLSQLIDFLTESPVPVPVPGLGRCSVIRWRAVWVQSWSTELMNLWRAKESAPETCLLHFIVHLKHTEWK